MSSVKVNFIYNIIYQILLIALPLVTSPYISRVLKDEGIGIYSFQFTIANCFALIAMLGINNYGSRTVAAVRDNLCLRSKAFWSIWLVQLVMFLGVASLYAVYVIWGCCENHRLVALVLSLTVLSSLFDVNWFFFGMEKFKLTVTRNIVIKILSVVMIFLFVKEETDVWKYSLIMGVSMFFSNAVIIPFLKREICFVKISKKDVLVHVPQILVLFVPIIAVTLYNKIDKVMLGWLGSMSETGFFENTEKIVNIPTGVVTALGTVMLPRMSYLFAKKENAIANKYFEFSLEFACAMSFGMTAGISLVANDFAPLFFGSAFASIGGLIIFLSPKVIFLSVANVLRTQYLIPLHKDKCYLKSVWYGAFANVAANLALIPHYGAFGAVISTLLAEFIVMFSQIFEVRKELAVCKMLAINSFYVLAAVLMFMTIKLLSDVLPEGWLGIIAKVILGCTIYILLCMPFVLKRHPEILKKSV